jgi:hypothetical protein
MTVKEHKEMLKELGIPVYMSREEAMADMEGAELEAFKELTGGTQVSFITNSPEKSKGDSNPQKTKQSGQDAISKAISNRNAT